MAQSNAAENETTHEPDLEALRHINVTFHRSLNSFIVYLRSYCRNGRVSKVVAIFGETGSRVRIRVGIAVEKVGEYAIER